VKRFYKAVTAVPAGEAFEIHLDGKPIRTPGRALLTAPTEKLAETIVEEWAAVKENVEPHMMPVTHIAYTAIDFMPAHRDEVVDAVVKYAETDLVCYRAEGPRKLQEFHANAFDPMVEWLAERFGVRLAVTQGVIPVTQDPEHLKAIREIIEGIDDLRLAALREIATITGSVAITLALWDNAIDPDTAWSVAQVDEDYHTSIWGEDPHATFARQARRQAMMAATKVLSSLTP
jgi:chaperone required for assembly of F1-ATPase